MKKEKVKERIAQGWTVELWLVPTKKHDKLTFKARMFSADREWMNDVSYFHVKAFLKPSQIEAKEQYDRFKTMQFRDWVDINVRKNRNNLTRADWCMLTIKEASTKVQSLELI